MFAVVVTGPPGSGKTTALTALSDALVEDGIAHAALDVDEVAWAYPFPDLSMRCAHLRAWRASHARAGASLVVVAEVIESAEHLAEVLAAIGADDQLVVRLHASPTSLRERIVAREPGGWRGLERLLDEAERLERSVPSVGGVHLVLDSEQLTPSEIAASIRAARADALSVGRRP